MFLAEVARRGFVSSDGAAMGELDSGQVPVLRSQANAFNSLLIPVLDPKGFCGCFRILVTFTKCKIYEAMDTV